MSNLYKSEGWKSLHKIDRAQLLLVIEGLKKGTIIGGNWTTFMDVINQTGLKYKPNTSRYLLDPAMVVAHEEDLNEYMRRNLTLPHDATSEQYFMITGEFLGYPACCIKEYSKPRTSQQNKALRSGKRDLSYKFGEEKAALVKSTGRYPEIFDYAPPSFTPCGIECKEAIKTLTTWKDAVDTLDPEAAKALRFFNKHGWAAD